MARHVNDVSQELERAERRSHSLSDWRRRHSRQMRTELYEAFGLIDALNRRFPAAVGPDSVAEMSVIPKPDVLEP